MTINPELVCLLQAFAVSYLPGVILAFCIWLIAKRKGNMPLFYADIVSFAFPIIVWGCMCKFNLTFVQKKHSPCDELAVLGWIWSLCVIMRLTIPRFTHKLRFRLAAIHVGSICTVAAVLLALFYQFCR